MICGIQYYLQHSECNGRYAKCMLMQPEPNDHDVRNDGDSEDEQHAARKIRVEDRCDEQR